MKKFLGSLALALLGGAILLSVPGCKTECGEDEESGATGCAAKSLTRFNGTPVTPAAVDYNVGDDITIETVYGNVKVVQGNATQFEVTFEPFDYEGYDEEDFAVRQMNENLDLSIQGSTIKAIRTGDTTNGLGAHITVKLPQNFNGKLSIINHGDGPLNEFESDIDYAASAVGIDIEAGDDGENGLTKCNVDGSPTVVNTNIDCGDRVKLLNVSDNVNVTIRSGTGFDEAIATISLASISATATGGTINVADGPIDITFPAGADYSLLANAPSGSVSSGTVPGTCTEDAPSEQSKGYTCGAGGPTYNITTNGENDSVFQAGTIYLHMQ